MIDQQTVHHVHCLPEPPTARTASQLLTLTLVTGLLLLAAAASVDGAAPSTRPVEGIRQNTPQVHALTGGRIVVAPGRVIPQGTIVLRDGIGAPGVVALVSGA